MTLYIAVNPVASKFAKTLQQALRNKIVDKVFRVDHQTAANKINRFPRRKVFSVTQQTRNKIEQLSLFKSSGVSSPRFTTHIDAVKELGKTVFARTLINSTNGRGIVEINTEGTERIVVAPLYTEYIPKKAEYRFHVFGDKVIDVQEKRKRRGAEINHRIRNVSNGYVYCRDDINPPSGAADLAIRAVQAVGYQYGAVDIIYNEKRNQCYVLEVNSRPGLMGTTLDKYSDAIIEMYQLRRK